MLLARSILLQHSNRTCSVSPYYLVEVRRKLSGSLVYRRARALPLYEILVNRHAVSEFVLVRSSSQCSVIGASVAILGLETREDAVRLIVEEGYSLKAACTAVGGCDATLRDWHRKLAPPPNPAS